MNEFVLFSNARDGNSLIFSSGYFSLTVVSIKYVKCFLLMFLVFILCVDEYGCFLVLVSC